MTAGHPGLTFGLPVSPIRSAMAGRSAPVV